MIHVFVLYIISNTWNDIELQRKLFNFFLTISLFKY